MNLEINKDIYMLTNMDTNNKIEEEEQEETIGNLSPKKKIKKEKDLNLEIITSSYVSKGTIIKLTPEGYPKGSNYRKDGITYFGYQDSQKNNDNDVSILKLILIQSLIDYFIKPKDDKIDDRFIGRHFQIKYNKKDYEYYLKDLGHGFGTFIKINEWVEIKNNFLLSIGENYIVITLGSKEDMLLNENNTDDNDENIINLKIFSGNIRHGNLSFSPKQSPFIIGRSQECDVIIDDNMLSRFHCSIEYKNDKWFITDGYIDNNNYKKSTNGTWLYAFEDTLITNGMIFKANNNLFICNF